MLTLNSSDEEMIEIDITDSESENVVPPPQPAATTGLYTELVAKLKEKNMFHEETSESEATSGVDSSASTIILQDVRKDRYFSTI